jgi:hypothetical protein
MKTGKSEADEGSEFVILQDLFVFRERSVNIY